MSMRAHKERSNIVSVVSRQPGSFEQLTSPHDQLPLGHGRGVTPLIGTVQSR